MTAKFSKRTPKSILFPNHVSKILPPAFFLFLIILSSTAFAQNIDLDISGQCKEFNVTVTATGFNEGCYDVKIDITTPDGRVGSIFDPREGWKSSFFYINEALCNETTSRAFAMHAASTDLLNFKATLKSGSKSWESSYYEFEQHCPVAADDYAFVILVSLIVVAVLLLAIALYVKPLKKIKSKK